jgi:histone-lysine N-methyltransferase SETD1
MRRKSLYVDAEKSGNVGRYINHSCTPNSIAITFTTIEGYVVIGIYAKTNINVNQEITIDYGWEVDPKIRKFLYFLFYSNI